MDVKTKFNCYDEIWFLHNKKSLKTKIWGMKIHVTTCPEETMVDVTYLCGSENDSKVFIKVAEDDAYKSKEDLLASL